MNSFPGAFNEYGRLAKVAVRGPDLALASDAKIDGEWRALNWHSRPDLGAARREFEAFAAILRRGGAELIELPAEAGLTLDSLYARDALVVTPRGIVWPRMGKDAGDRRGDDLRRTRAHGHGRRHSGKDQQRSEQETAAGAKQSRQHPDATAQPEDEQHID